MTDLAPALRLARDQCGLLSRAQLSQLEVPRGAVRWALDHGWRHVLPSVICTGPTPLTERQRLIAALLHTGRASMIGSLAAAHWHGVTAAADPRVHVLTPMDRHPRSAGFVIVRRTRRADVAPWQRAPLTLASRPRAVVDAARDAPSADQATAIVCEAFERRLVPLDALRHELEAGPRPGSRQVRAAVELAEAGAWSVPEGVLYHLVRRSPRLSPMWLNPMLRAADGVSLPTPDGWFDAVGLAVQVHSRRWHDSADTWDSTVMADGVFAEYGVPLVAVTPHALARSPDRILQRLERAHLAAAGRPRPAVSAVPRSGVMPR